MGKQNIYEKLMPEIGNLYGVCGLMGNLQAESDFNPKNMQNSYESKLKMNDETYTAAVDNGTYADFATDRVGYGLAQWTSAGRKAGLLDFAKSNGKSIGDEDMQIEYLIHELNTAYKNVMKVLKNAASVKEASDCVVTKFERPKNQSESALKKRQEKGEAIYKEFAPKETGVENMPYTNSPLVSYTKLSPHKTSPRNHTIDRFTPHVYVGQVTVQRALEGFFKASKKASCNYVVGYDGEIGLCVEEKDRSKCSSNEANDQRAITVEIASDTKAPYSITDAAYNALIDLAVDVCKRNGKSKMLWLGNKEKTLAYKPKPDEMVITVHRWFAAKSCPGDYVYSRLGQIAEEVNARLGNADVNPKPLPDNDEPAYALKDFIKDVQAATGANVDGIAGPETISKTVTVSATKNRKHKVVSAIQKRLNALGYDCGTVDGIAGPKFTAAVKAYQKANGCVSDGEITAKNKTWKKLLGMN